MKWLLGLVVLSLFVVGQVSALYSKNGKVAIFATSSQVVPPAAQLHVDAGTGTVVAAKFTAGTTTGQATTDGFNVGIDATGAAVVSQLENNSMVFNVNGLEACRYAPSTVWGTKMFCGLNTINTTQEIVNLIGNELNTLPTSASALLTGLNINSTTGIVGGTATSALNLVNVAPTHTQNIGSVLANNGRYQSEAGAAGTFTEVNAYRGIMVFGGAETITAAHFYNARNPAAPTGGATITGLAGVVVEGMTRGTNNTNLLLGTLTIPTGNFSLYNASTSNNYHAGNVGLGITAPTAKLHIDGGTSTASGAQWTVGSTTGQTSSDGFHVGVTTTGVAELRQKENLDLVVYTNDTERQRVTATGTFIQKNKIEFEDPDSGTAVVAVQASESIVTPYTLTLPASMGTNNQVLSIGGRRGATLDLVFATASGGSGTTYAWQGKYGVDCTWTYTTNSFGTIGTGDSTCTFTEVYNSNFGTVTSGDVAGNKIPQILFTPDSAGYYQVCASMGGTNNTSNEAWAMQIYDGTNSVAESYLQYNNAATYNMITICGIIYAPSTAQQTLSIRFRTTGGTTTLNSNSVNTGTSFISIGKL